MEASALEWLAESTEQIVLPIREFAEPAAPPLVPDELKQREPIIQLALSTLLPIVRTI
jgi:hypothetical protein